MYMYYDPYVTSPKALWTLIFTVLDHSLTTVVAADSDLEPRRLGAVTNSSSSNALSALKSPTYDSVLI